MEEIWKELKEKVAENHDFKKLVQENEEIIKDLRKKVKHLESIKAEI